MNHSQKIADAVTTIVKIKALVRSVSGGQEPHAEWAEWRKIARYLDEARKGMQELVDSWDGASGEASSTTTFMYGIAVAMIPVVATATYSIFTSDKEIRYPYEFIMAILAALVVAGLLTVVGKNRSVLKQKFAANAESAKKCGVLLMEVIDSVQTYTVPRVRVHTSLEDRRAGDLSDVELDLLRAIRKGENRGT